MKKLKDYVDTETYVHVENKEQWITFYPMLNELWKETGWDSSSWDKEHRYVSLKDNALERDDELITGRTILDVSEFLEGCIPKVKLVYEKNIGDYVDTLTYIKCKNKDEYLKILPLLLDYTDEFDKTSYGRSCKYIDLKYNIMEENDNIESCVEDDGYVVIDAADFLRTKEPAIINNYSLY